MRASGCASTDDLARTAQLVSGRRRTSWQTEILRQWNALQQDIETVARTALHASFSVPASLIHGQTPLDGTQQRMHITWSVTAASDNDLNHAFAELDGWLSQSHNKR